MDGKINKHDLSNKFATIKDTADQDGKWRPEPDIEGKETKYFKKGDKFPLYKGQKVPWRLVERD